jgi:hypothetical protein
MTREDALEILGLSSEATDGDVRQRFRELAKAVHPDVGGNEKALAQLLEARGTLLGDEDGGALVPITQVTDLVRAATGSLAAREEQRELREQTRALVDQLLRARTNPLRELRRRAGFLTALAGVFAVFAQVLRALPWSARVANLASVGAAGVAAFSPLLSGS